MNRLFVITTATLTAIIGVLVGLLLTVPRPAQAPAAARPSSSPGDGTPAISEVVDTRPASGASLNFADIAARLNPAVVNIDATARGRRAQKLIEEGGRGRWRRC